MFAFVIILLRTELANLYGKRTTSLKEYLDSLHFKKPNKHAGSYSKENNSVHKII